MYLKIILKVTKNQGFILSLEDTGFEKPQEGEQIDFTFNSHIYVYIHFTFKTMVQSFETQVNKKMFMLSCGVLSCTNTGMFCEASFNFLDLNVKLSNGKIQSFLRVKPTDRH